MSRSTELAGEDRTTSSRSENRSEGLEGDSNATLSSFSTPIIHYRYTLMNWQLVVAAMMLQLYTNPSSYMIV